MSARARSATYDRTVFATLLGGLPSPPAPEVERARGRSAARAGRVEAAIRAQEAAGLEPLTDGRLAGDDVEGIVERWRFASSLTDRAVKQAVTGPSALARRGGRERTTLRRAIEELAAAGCPLIEVEEPEPQLVGDVDAWRRFGDAHERLLRGIGGVHVSLSITGGPVPEGARAHVLALPYASFALDLIAGPDSWNVAALAPGDRGIVAGVVSGREGVDEPKEVLLWAAHYAASTGGRGLARVGLGSAGSWASCTWEAALRKLRLLGDAARLAGLPPSEELARQLDPAAVSARRAALGHDAPPSPPAPRRSPGRARPPR